MNDELTDSQQLVSALFKNAKGEPIILSPGQDSLYRLIAMKDIYANTRLHVMSHTRWGKSFTVALATLSRVSTFAEKWAIIAPKKDKAKIIMDHIISHIFDNDYTKERFAPEEGEDIEDIRRYRNKNRLTFKVGKTIDAITGKKINLYGEVFIGSAADALGFGAENVIEDEAALIDDNDHSLVVRMLGDDPHKNFLVKIGNPFRRNHFLTSYHDPMFKKVVFDCYKSLSDGRITQKVIDENRPYSFFPILYECNFPRASEVDESGWMYLFNDLDIITAKKRSNLPYGEPILGVDVMRGGRNYNVWVLRTGNVARVVKKTIEPDLIPALEDTINIIRENGIDPSNVNVDDSGVGGGLTDMLKMRGIIINPVNFGESGEKEIKPNGEKKASEYANVRAEVYAGKQGLRTWLKTSGQIVDHADWIQLTKIRYKKDMNGKIKIEPKEDMRKRGIESPDVADGLALTFARPKIMKSASYHPVDPAFILSGGVKPLYDGLPG